MKSQCSRIHTRSKIQGRYQAGESLSSISKDLGISRTTARKWAEMDDGQIHDQKRSGRPTKMTPDTKKRIKRLSKEKIGVGYRSVAKKLDFSDDFLSRKKSVSNTTVRRFIKKCDWGKYSYKQKIKPMLSAKNIADRISFCQRMVSQEFTDENSTQKIDHVLFTDESPVELYPVPNRQNSRFRTNNPQNVPIVKRPKHGIKIFVAGGISGNGKTNLHIVEEKRTINGDYYRNKILPEYFDSFKNISQFPEPSLCVLMQDGAPCHTAKATIDIIQKDYSVWRDWPGNSPDLNPIEHLWARLQDSVFREPRPKNRSTLISRVIQEWQRISIDEIKVLIHSFPNRVREALKNNGGFTNY